MDGKDLTPYIITIGIVIVLVMAAGIFLFVLRGRLLEDEEAGDAGTGGILESMRGMRDRGEISEEEYRTAQVAIVAKASAEKPAGGETPKPKPAKNQTVNGKLGDLRAAPGFDLTGERLPPGARRGSEEKKTDFD